MYIYICAVYLSIYLVTIYTHTHRKVPKWQTPGFMPEVRDIRFLGSQKWDDTKNGPAETAGPISGALPKLRIFENSIGL